MCQEFDRFWEYKDSLKKIYCILVGKIDKLIDD